VNKREAIITVIVILLVYVGAAMIGWGLAHPVPEEQPLVTVIHDRIPMCPEDSVLVGVGQFEHGRWDAYTCGPARDDYASPSTSTLDVGRGAWLS
jgi:hypothetical protein